MWCRQLLSQSWSSDEQKSFRAVSKVTHQVLWSNWIGVIQKNKCFPKPLCLRSLWAHSSIPPNRDPPQEGQTPGDTPRGLLNQGFLSETATQDKETCCCLCRQSCFILLLIWLWSSSQGHLYLRSVFYPFPSFLIKIKITLELPKNLIINMGF